MGDIGYEICISSGKVFDAARSLPSGSRTFNGSGVLDGSGRTWGQPSDFQLLVKAGPILIDNMRILEIMNRRSSKALLYWGR